MDVLLVDLGGVLFSFDHPYRLQALGQRLGLSPDRVGWTAVRYHQPSDLGDLLP